jgi:integrase
MAKCVLPTDVGDSGTSWHCVNQRRASVVFDCAWLVLSLLAGLRTEELRSLLWSDVDLDAATVAVHRSVRSSGDTKTPKSRRDLKLPIKAVEALKDHRGQQATARLKAGTLWQDHGLVFASAVGTPLDAHNVRRSFRAITTAAGLGEEWTPRGLPHTFVSLLSAHNVTLEDIARLVGHSGTTVTERIYRHEIRPSLTQGAEIMDQLFQ